MKEYFRDLFRRGKGEEAKNRAVSALKNKKSGKYKISKHME